MKISTKMYIAAGLLAGLVVATSANAVTVDFTVGAPWNAGGTSITDGIVTVDSAGGTISSFDDGLGVTGGSPDTEGDEVDNAESLTVTFSTPVIITSIWLDDFWNTTSTGGSVEEAFVTVNGTTSFTLMANKAFNNATDPTSFDFTSLFAGAVTSLLFEAIDPATASNNGDDYALARIDYTAAAVPVPAAFWLLGSAMVFLFRKRQTS